MIALPRLREVEAELRFARAKEVLDTLRRYLLVQVHYLKYTRSNVRGQRANTRSQSLLQRTASKIESTATQYCRTREAYQKLRGPGDWEHELRLLTKQDIRPLKESHIAHEDGSKALGEGNKTVSWIWRASLSNLKQPRELNDGQYVPSSSTLIALNATYM